MTAAARFRASLRSGRTVWAAGAYDAMSARLIAQAGFDAVLTSGFGVAASFLGPPDAELYTMTDEQIYQLYYQNPKLGFYFMKLIVERLLRDVQRHKGPVKVA